VSKAIALLLGIPSLAGMYVAYLIIVRGDGIVLGLAMSGITALIVRILTLKEKK